MASNPEWLVVAQVDFNCWALSPRVVERMGMFDYSHNKLGWGTDWAALAFCFANRLLVVRDLAIKVDHPKSRSYDSSMAEEQMRLFLNQLFRPHHLFHFELHHSVPHSLQTPEV